MLNRATAIVLGVGLLGAGLQTGCGPTSHGKKMRQEAKARLDDANTRISYQQAEQSFKVARFERALREIDTAIARFPEASEYHLLRGRIMLETHKLDPALQAFRTALEKDETNADAHYFSGIVYQRWSEHEAAYEEYAAAIEADGSRVEFVLAAAESLIDLGRFEEARQIVEPKLAYFEHNAAMHHLLGQIAMFQGRAEAAVDGLTRARMLNPEDRSLLLELSRAQYEAGQYGKCMESLRLLQMNSREDNPELMRMEARCLALMGQGTEARNIYQRLTQRNAADVDAWIELGSVAWELGDFHRVSQCGIRATGLDPSRYEGYLLQAVNERHHGNRKEAAGLFRQAAERAPGKAVPHLLLGSLYEEQGDLAEALLAYRDALEAEPSHAEARAMHDRLARIAAPADTASVPVDP